MVGQSGSSEDVNFYLSRSAYIPTPIWSYMDITLPIDLPRNTIRKIRFQDLACGGGYVSGLARAQINHQSNARGLLGAGCSRHGESRPSASLCGPAESNLLP